MYSRQKLRHRTEPEVTERVLRWDCVLNKEQKSTLSRIRPTVNSNSPQNLTQDRNLHISIHQQLPSMRSQHHLTVRVPLPRDLPPKLVVSALQSYTPILRHQALVSRYQQAGVDTASVQADSFFRPDGLDTAAFTVYERVTILPGLSKEITFPVLFQRFNDGIRSRATAPAGVTVYSQHVVSRIGALGMSSIRGWVDDGGEWLSGDRAMQARMEKASSKEVLDVVVGGGEAGEYEMVETVSVECNFMMMPFVKGSMEDAHRDICRKVVEEVMGSSR